MRRSDESNRNERPDARASQSLRNWLIALATFAFWASSSLPSADAQIHDSLDAHPPRWHLDTSDCDAQTIKQEHLLDGGLDGGGCEAITFTAKNGTEAILVYPIQPVQPLDDLTANVSVMSAKAGARIGFRVRFPYLRDKETRRPVAIIVYGTSYESGGGFGSLGVGLIERELRKKVVVVRHEYGSDADVSDPYVDAVVLNAYSGPGTTTLRMDELRIDGLIPVGEAIVTGNRPPTRNDRAIPRSQGMLRVSPESVSPPNNGVVQNGNPQSNTERSNETAFPVGRVTRILQYNDEPLSWVRALGFDAVLLSKPPTAAILREAISARVAIYAPPPSAPDPQLEPLLTVVRGWYLGSGKSLDGRHLQETALRCERLRAWPSRWQRPLVAAPAERWREYAALTDALINDLPIRNRGISGGEEVAEMNLVTSRVGDRVELGVGIASMPAEIMLKQAEAISDLIGAQRPASFRWHAMWLQAMRSLETTPSAILFRSSRSLASGNDLASNRSMALSYVNRMIAMISPWVATSTPAPPPPIVGAPYRCTRLQTGNSDLLILTSIATRGSEVLAGDGDELQIQLSPNDRAKTIWRMTHFSAERLTSETTATGISVQVVSPDAVEVIVLSGDPEVGTRLAQSASRFGRQAGLDRWQLATELVRQTRDQWNSAVGIRAADRPSPTSLLSVAESTMDQAEPLYRAGDIEASLRMARRADAWALRCQWQLSEALMPDWPKPTSCPPMDCGWADTQIAWRPLMNAGGWGKNVLSSGTLDTQAIAERWSFGKRMAGRVDSEVMFASRGTFQGTGALRARVTPLSDDPLPGGYEGTAVQIRSPSVKVPAGKAIRLDAMVRTLGFGGAHQGVLVYDTVGGQELGVLVRGRSDWTPVRLYRQTIAETDVSVMFELIGGGEVTIDDVEFRIWDPDSQQPLPLRPIAQGDSTLR